MIKMITTYFPKKFMFQSFKIISSKIPFFIFRKEVTLLLVAFLAQQLFERVLGSFEMLTLLRSHYSSIMLH